MPHCTASKRWLACRQRRVKAAKRSRIVALKRSIKDVLICLPPCELCKQARAADSSPRKSVRLTSTVRCLRCFLITCPISRCGQDCKEHRPFPEVVFTFSRNARTIALGYAAHPSTH